MVEDNQEIVDPAVPPVAPWMDHIDDLTTKIRHLGNAMADLGRQIVKTHEATAEKVATDDIKPIIDTQNTLKRLIEHHADQVRAHAEVVKDHVMRVNLMTDDHSAIRQEVAALAGRIEALENGKVKQ